MYFLKAFLLASAFVGTMTACTPIADYTQEYAERKAAGVPLVIAYADTEGPNSAGGVDVRINALNVSSKTIKYLRYTVVPYNAVGDRVSGTIRRRSAARIFDTGPIAPDASSPPGVWDNVWYNSSIRCLEITRVRIEYMDGTSRTFTSRGSISNLMRSDIVNSCR